MSEIEKLRKAAGVTQTEMASCMGLPLRTYQDIEGGRGEARPVHHVAAFWALVRLALAKNDGGLIGFTQSKDIIRAAVLIASAIVRPEYPLKSNIIVTRMKKGWTVTSYYPPGEVVPIKAMPFDLRWRPSLSAVLDHILEYHSDPILSGGVEPNDKAITSFHPGMFIVLERQHASWKSIVYAPDGGLVGRNAPYSSIGDALVDVGLEKAPKVQIGSVEQ